MQTVFEFLSPLLLRDHSKWRANMGRDNAHPNVRSKSSERKKIYNEGKYVMKDNL